VRQLVGLDRDENGFSRWRLDFAKFTPKILSENVVKTSAECNRLLADQLEAPVERTEDLILQEDPRFQSFFDIGVLRGDATRQTDSAFRDSTVTRLSVAVSAWSAAQDY
jgi:hypothetical protein